MAFKSEFQAKLKAGTEHKELLVLVRQFKNDGLGQRDAYDQLQELWLEYGFDDDDGGKNPLRDNLEYVMEIVWGYCPAASRIWDDSLTRQNQPT